MRIKRVEILGFKSFVDKVTLDVQDGITGIVGPNGCGKSNIVDAIRWAMGEQNAKNLRGRGMEDVIFGGSESRKPLGMAEVSLVFANDDGLAPPAFREFAEIMVTRRLYRNGESDYQINKTPCRLLDITELFMDTGVGARAYSIIEQGKIGMILNAKPEDRRFLIEEAAGVTKFKSRKKTALRKIEATRHNLQRLADIVAEVRRQLGGLKRQAQKAQRFKELREEFRTIELRIARGRYGRLSGELVAAAAAESEHQRSVELLAAEEQRLELLGEEARLVQVAAEKDVTLGQEKVFHLATQMQQAEGRIEFAGKELENLVRQQERLAAEIAEAGQRQQETEREEEQLQHSGSALGADMAGAQRRLAEGETALEELAEAERDAAARLEDGRSRLFALLSELSRLGSQHEEAERRLRSQAEREARNRHEAIGLREQLEQVRRREGEIEAALHGVRAHRLGLTAEREGCEERLRLLRRQLDENEQALLVAREELNRQASRLESLRELERNLEGYGSGVRLILQDAALAGRFAGMLADAVEVPGELEAAFEAVLGERLQALLAAEPAAIDDALALLRRSGGRSTFLVPMTAGAAVPFPDGRPLAGLVSARSDSEAVVAALLRGVYLVEDLDPHLRGAGLAPGTLLVTPAGETLSWRGEYRGGAREVLTDGVLHKKREIKELIRSLAERQEAVAALQRRREELREELREAEQELVELGAALHRQDLQLVDHEKDLAGAQKESVRLLERVEVLSFEEDQLHEERVALERQLAEADSGRVAKEEERAGQEETVRTLQEELLVRRRALETVREQVTALKVETASLREREEGERRSRERLGRLRQELRGRLALLESRVAEGERERQRLETERERHRVELTLLFEKHGGEKGRFDRLRERYEEGQRRIEAQEEILKQLRQRLAEARRQFGALQLRTRELQLEGEHLAQAILERYRVDLSELDRPESDDCDEGAANRRLDELRRAIDEIGEVNLMAVDEYRELDERYQFLTRQQDDLRQSLDGLQTAIGKINRTTRKRFRETFDLVNAKFQEIFPRLFRGGRAELRLTDEEDLLETGIEIIVQPPGKKLQNVTLLSGGEKALTAVALIFSIFLVKPSPFCLLDEVDAPLDDANIGRFNEMVREMAQISQFVIITHSKRTMEIADTLYGVTMEEPGVSKLVSVRLNDF